jgi:hypothetical protein
VPTPARAVPTAHIVIDTQPGKAGSVANFLSGLEGMERPRVEGDQRVVVRWQIPDGQNPEPEGLSEVLRSMTDEIVQAGLVEEEQRS